MHSFFFFHPKNRKIIFAYLFPILIYYFHLCTLDSFSFPPQESIGPLDAAMAATIASGAGWFHTSVLISVFASTFACSDT